MNLVEALALAAQATEKTNQQGLPPIVMAIPLILLALYFIVIRPQKRDEQRQTQMRSSVKKGDKVVTIGGIHGTVAGVDTTNDVVSVQVDRNVKLDFSRDAIQRIKDGGRDSDESGKK